MTDDAWKTRLAAAIENSGKSMRAISLAAGKGPGYLHALLREGKEPTLASLLTICDELGVSLAYIVYGQDLSKLDEDFLTLMSKATDSEKQAVLNLLRSITSKS